MSDDIITLSYMYEAAYPVPFVFERTPPRYRLHNVSDETLDGVALAVHGAGVLAANVPARLEPGEALDVRIAGPHLHRDTILVVRWFRFDGVEYLWRVSF